MKDSECVQLLQWVLPRLRMRWAGFRKVRKQVCKRIQRRMHELELHNVAAYRAHLERHGDEWRVLDGLCRVTVSRFYRDKGVFRFVEQEVFPELGRAALARGDHTLRLWSAGCGSGEEPYTLALLWEFGVKSRFPALGVRIVATDADDNLIRRAAEARYSASGLKDLPVMWRDAAFEQRTGLFCLKSHYKSHVELSCHDLRTSVPDGPFDLILCRNLAFTYFDLDLQLEVASRFRDALCPGGALVVGAHERLPDDVRGFTAWSEGASQRSPFPILRLGLLSKAQSVLFTSLHF